MKVTNTLLLAGQPYSIVDLDIRRELNRPAVASFTVAGTAPTQGVVVFSFSVASQTAVLSHRRWFSGYIEKTLHVNSNESKVLCKDFTARLSNTLPLALRNTTMEGVLFAITDTTGITFNKPNANYLKATAAYFYHVGSGLAAIRSLANVFGIANFEWQQQADGHVWCGSQEHAPWYKHERIPTPMFNKHLSNGSVEMAPMPSIRPGVFINDKQVETVTLTDKMVLKWKH